ncbi:hypothetical protein [Streptomyces sp. NBC_00572]|uniref:hypothetical protein n=1 Tax=Streptomyces sp. NBC_00572 TaxID=2903664 RepID=UPI00224FE3BF|nr:hypothetical protein [Streptomyces sp. NBC_00572]MCX4983470.1 hypothetical protein [Streptomyces sp. NBC_00572]
MDWIALGSMLAAASAFTLSIIALLVSRKQEKRILFLSLNERLMQPELQEGRTLLRESIESTSDAENVYALNKNQHWSISRAVAMFDLLGLYVKHGYIKKDLALEEWGKTLTLSYEGHGEHFVRAREEALGWSPYPHFKYIAEMARREGLGHPR